MNRVLINFVSKRWKHGKNHWKTLEKKTYPTDRALQNFDDFYASVYGNRWKSIRVALLTQHKYVALVNNFGDVFETMEALESQGAFNVRLMYYSETNDPQKKNLEDLTRYMANMDQNMDKIIQNKQTDEIRSLYPSDAENIPGKLRSPGDSSTTAASQPIDYKKSLTDVINENSEIDERRVIDSEMGMGALHEFVPATEIKGVEDWVLESDHYKYYSNTVDFPLKIVPDADLVISDNLAIYSYEEANVSEFIPPKTSTTGVLSHFLMDGASILPPIVLGVKPGDRVLDACAAPGGKSLILLQTLWPDVLVCNDVQESRINRIKKVMNQYLYDFKTKWEDKRVIICHNDARNLDHYGTFDKILVDVPCTTDRHSVMENDNNIFKPSRVKERLRLPEVQAGILSNCIRLLKPGGSLVYSTCSLSPVQNDGVVHMALSRVFKEFEISVTINDLTNVIHPFRHIFKFQDPKLLKYGQLVLPYLPSNFGPMYFCKITRDN